MYRIKNDRRSERSVESMYDALRSLIREKPYTTISVRDIVERAGVSRSTFYRNFDVIGDILHMQCDQVFDELAAYLTSYRRETDSHEHGDMLVPILRFFYLHSEIIDLLMQANRIDLFQRAFRTRSQPIQARLAADEEIPLDYVAYVAEVRINVLIAILTHWVSTGKRHAPDELADTLKAILYSKITTIAQLL